jgi:Rrf2 family cysteine metabolism transcriptional repressor
MTELASAYEEENPVSLKRVGEHMQVSDGYLEEIAGLLKNAKLIKGVSGPKGGYRLSRHPELITAEDIVRAIEGDINLVKCHDEGVCPLEGQCRSKGMWDFLQDTVSEALKKKRLSALIKK